MLYLIPILVLFIPAILLCWRSHAQSSQTARLWMKIQFGNSTAEHWFPVGQYTGIGFGPGCDVNLWKDFSSGRPLWKRLLCLLSEQSCELCAVKYQKASSGCYLFQPGVGKCTKKGTEIKDDVEITEGDCFVMEPDNDNNCWPEDGPRKIQITISNGGPR